MAVVKTYDESTNLSLDNVSIIIFNSSGKKVGGYTSGNSGTIDINDSFLSDKGGKIEFTRINYNPLSVEISKFSGTAFLKPAEISVLGNVIVKAKKKDKKKVVLKNPFDRPIPPPELGGKKADKKFPTWALVAGGLILIAAGAYFIFKRK